jgi:CTD small phosphatase-like protein 2
MVKLPALRMKRMFHGDDCADEFKIRTMKSMKVSHFHVSELEQSAMSNLSDKTPQDGK